MFSRIFLFSLLMISNQLIAVETLEDLSLRLSRSSSSYMDLSVTVDNVPTSRFEGGASSSSAQTLLVKNLDVCLVAIDGVFTDSAETCSQMLKYDGQISIDETAEVEQTNEYFMSFQSINITKEDSVDQYKIDAVLRIQKESSSSSAASFTTSYQVNIYFATLESGQISTEGLTATEITPANEEPANLSAAAQHKGFVLYWDEDEDGVIALQDGSTTTITNTRAYIFDVTNGSRSLNIAKTYDASDSSSSDQDMTACNLNVTLESRGDEADSCSYQCPSLGYLSYDLATAAGDADSSLGFQSKTTTTNAVSFGELLEIGDATDRYYAAMVQYDPDGLLQQDTSDGTYKAQCVIVRPTLNVTYAQLTGAGNSKESDPSCFIATAAYGSPLHKDLYELRWFRDAVLAKTWLGRRFIEAYYRISPPIAKSIVFNPTAKSLLRGVLWVPVQLIKHARESSAMLQFSLFFISLISISMLRRRFS